MNKENKLVPELRFPEFKNTADWSENTLGNTAQFLKGKGISKSDISDNGIHPCIRYGELYTHYKETIKLIKSFTNLPFSELVLSQANDVIIPASGETKEDIATASCVMESGIALGSDLNIIRSKINGVFLSYYLNNAKKKDIAKVAQGISVVHLYPDQLKSLNIHIPQPAEQLKIASCLSSLDELINAHRQKLDVFKEHKKGMMQQLFPAEGKKTPKLRFNEFIISGDWKEKLLGEIADILMCKRIFAEETNGNKGIPFYKIGTLGGKPDAFISKELFEEYKSKYNYPRKGEILITCSGTVGKCIVYNGQDAYYQDSNIVWVDNPTLEICNELLYYLISNVDWSMLNSTTITRIYGADLRNLKLTFPKNQIEQKKIANNLSTLDESIDLQGQIINTLNTHKKGLIQGLFPNI